MKLKLYSSYGQFVVHDIDDKIISKTSKICVMKFSDGEEEITLHLTNGHQFVYNTFNTSNRYRNRNIQHYKLLTRKEDINFWLKERKESSYDI